MGSEEEVEEEAKEEVEGASEAASETLLCRAMGIVTDREGQPKHPEGSGCTEDTPS